MKRVLFALATGLLCGQALAADLPMPAPTSGAGCLHTGRSAIQLDRHLHWWKRWCRMELG